MSLRSLSVALALASAVVQPAASQTLTPEKKAAYDLHIHRAEAAATLGPMTQGMLDNLCALPSEGRGRVRPSNEVVEPAKVFDNLYFLGVNNVSAWAIKTSDGIILIDSLFNAKDAEETIAGGLRKVGLDPREIKYVVITHGHGDHFGGAPYLAEHFKARVLASEADWALMKEQVLRPGGLNSPVPAKDLVVTDGQKLTLGDTTISLYITPGHTAGTVSVLLPVSQDGKKHTAVLWGGTGFTAAHTVSDFNNYALSADRLSGIAKAAGADILLSNHSTVDLSLTRLPIVRARKPGDANPYVIGQDAIGKAFTVLKECGLARGAAL